MKCDHLNRIDGRKKKRMKWLQILDEMKKIYFEESKKNQDLFLSTKSPIEIKDVHIEFDNMHNNDTKMVSYSILYDNALSIFGTNVLFCGIYTTICYQNR